MVKVTDQNYYLDGYVASNLTIMKELIKKDWDFICLIDGREGTGKSVLGLCLSYFCNQDFTIKNIAFTANQFRKAILEAKPYTAILYDEAYTGLSSRGAMTFINRALVQMIAEIRQKNLFVFIVMPCYFDLDKYFALWRSACLFHVYTDERMNRGYLAFYNYERKKELYMRGKKFYDYTATKPNFIGRFTNHYTVPEQEYRKLKKEALMHREEAREASQRKAELEAQLLERVMMLPDTIPHKIKMEILQMPSSTYFAKLSQKNSQKD